MKTSRFFPSVILFFAFFLFTQTSFAQNYNPLHVAELELSDAQKDEIKSVDKNYSTQISALYKMDNSEIKDYQAISEKRKTLKKEQDEARKAILTKEQLEQFEGYIVEQKSDSEARRITSRMNRLERKYPGIEITEEQAYSIIEKEDKVRQKASDDHEGSQWKAFKKAKKEIYREVLDDTQFTIYEAIEKAKKTEQENIALKEIKKALPVAEEMIPMLEEFALPKFIVLRNKLEAKISDADKRELAHLRVVRKQQFDAVLEKEFYSELNDLEIENAELQRYADFSVDLFEANKDNAVNLFPGNLYRGTEDAESLKKLIAKYIPEIDKMEAELIWLIKETVKKGAVIASEEYPIPPVAIILNEIKDIPAEVKALFLLLDPEVEFSMDLPNFEKGEGTHFASVYPNPAKKDQTLEFYLPQDDLVTIEILDESGRTVKTISSENMSQGKHTLAVDTQNLNSQLYFYRITTGEKVTMLKFSVVK